MSIKLEINLHAEDAVNDATQITRQLKDKNYRGVKVKQAQAEPEDGSLDFAEFLPIIELVINSSLATAFVTQLFGLLKNGFFTKSKEIASNERIKLAEIEANKETKLAETQLKRDYIELGFECGDKKYNFVLTMSDTEQQKQILEALKEMQKECE